jgi:putative GTP pyrophosphokinase
VHGQFDPPALDGAALEQLRGVRDQFARFMMEYRFAVSEVLTKVEILRDEFRMLHRYNPIEHVSSRVKSPESLLEKVRRKGCEPTFAAMREAITDIAGLRITCSFIADTYQVLEALISQDDVTVLTVKDYIVEPKPNGYKSLHVLVEIPVFLSTGPVQVPVEVQIRTIAMDFWASLEHKIFYKYDGEVPPHLAAELKDAATAAERLDHRMEQLHTEVRGAGGSTAASTDTSGVDDDLAQRLAELLRRRS